MPKFDNNIKTAILKAVEKEGSQASFCRKTGISTSLLSKYTKGNVENINTSTWNMIYPTIKDFLPIQYHNNSGLPSSPENHSEISNEKLVLLKLINYKLLKMNEKELDDLNIYIHFLLKTQGRIEDGIVPAELFESASFVDALKTKDNKNT